MEEPKRCINDLPDDLLMKILVRFPCKSLFKYKSVSKRWFAFISERSFALSFSQHYKPWHIPLRFVADFFYVSKQVLLITSRPKEFDNSVSPSFLPCFRSSSQEEEASIVGSYEDLLLCSSIRDNQKIYYVCNLLTKHWVVLPPNPSSQEQQEVRSGFICYHLNDNSRSSFKVVLLTEFLGSKSQINVETFSSVTGQWTKFVVSCPHNIEINLCGSGITCNGKLHWFMPFDNKILVYNPNCDKVHAIIDGPKEANPLLGSQCFGVFCRGRKGRKGLQIAQVQSLCPTQCSLSKWTLCNITGKWCLEHQINLAELTAKNRPLWRNINVLPKVNVLALHPLYNIVYLGIPKYIIACSLQTKIVNIFKEPPYEIPLQGFMHMLPTWPTLVPALPRSKRKADGAEVEDGEVEPDMATR